MPGSRLYNFTLGQPQFEITPFQAVAFEPKERENISILNDALDTLELRENRASDSLTAMDSAFATLQRQLHQDKDTLQWFENFKKKYKGEVEAFANLGNYSAAARFGKQLAAEMLNDGELIGHQHAFETWKKERDEVAQKAKTLDDAEGLKLWEKENGYDVNNISFIKDQDGNITGAEDYKITRDYYEPINWTKDVWGPSFSIINPDQIAKSSSKGSQVSRGNDYGSQSSGRETSHSTNFSQVTADDVLKSFELYTTGIGMSEARIKWDFDKRINERNSLQEEYNSLSEADKASTKGKDLLYRIGLLNKVLIHNNVEDYKSYYAEMVAGGKTAKEVAELMAYKHSSVSDAVNTNSSKNKHTPGADTIAAEKALHPEQYGNDGYSEYDNTYSADSKPGNKVKIKGGRGIARGGSAGRAAAKSLKGTN